MSTRAPGPFNFRKRHRAILLAFLSAAAGGLDAYALLRLGHVFVSALSGTTVLLGVALASQRLGSAVLAGTVFLGFLPGVLVGTLLMRDRARRYAWDQHVERVLALEAGTLTFLLLCVTWGWPLGLVALFSVDIMVFLAAFAMGLQNTAGRGVNPSGVTTTYVTGPILRLARKAAGKNRTPLREPPSEGLRPEEDPGRLPTESLFVAVWVAYFGGVVVEVVLLRFLSAIAFAFPTLLVVEVAVVAPLLDVWRPSPERAPGAEVAGRGGGPGVARSAEEPSAEATLPIP